MADRCAPRVLFVGSDPGLEAHFEEVDVVLSRYDPSSAQHTWSAADVAVVAADSAPASPETVLPRLLDRPGDLPTVCVIPEGHDAVDLPLPFDECIVRPVTPAELTRVVHRVVVRSRLEAEMTDLFRLASRLGRLEVDRDDGRPPSDRYRELRERFDARQAASRDCLAQVPIERAFAAGVLDPDRAEPGADRT